VLRTGGFALAAVDAVLGAAVVFDEALVVEAVGHHGAGDDGAFGVIIEREEVGNGNVLRTAFHAVAAGGAGNHGGGVDDLDGFGEHFAFLIGERFEILHVGGVVEQLIIGGHAAEYHYHAFEACGETHGPGGDRGFGVIGLEQLLRLGRQGSEVAALDGFHHDDGLLMLDGDFVAFARTDAGVVPVDVVDLQLDEIELGMRGEHLVEQLGRIVERHADVLRFALGLHAGGEREGIELLRLFIGAYGDVVDEEVIHVVHAQLLELFIENIFLILHAFEDARRNFGGDGEAVSAVAFGHGFPESDLAFVAVVDVGGVEVGEAAFEERIDHFFYGLHIKRRLVVFVQERQTHESEAEFFCHEILL